MKLTVLEEYLLDSIPSGSGVVLHKGRLIIIADDAPFIYNLSLEDYRYEAIPLAGYPAYPYRIPKPVKPDFEAATKGVIDGQEYIFAFGSGSMSPTRDSMLMVSSEDLTNQKIVPITTFYQSLRHQTKLSVEQWNIEGAVTNGDELLLLNRGSNSIIAVKWNSFIRFIQEGTLPVATSYKLELPAHKGHIARLSGACTLNSDDDILFCASIEDTPNWYSDGTVLGSYIGVFNAREKTVKAVAMVMQPDGSMITDKIESVEVLATNDKLANVVAVADDDKGHTKIFRIRIRW